MTFDRLTDRPDSPALTPFEARCPYCRHKNTFRLQKPEADNLTRTGRARIRELVTCDNEDGGCDTEFVLHVEASLTFAVEALPLAGFGRDVEPAPDSDGVPGVGRADSRDEADLRVWTLVTKGPDEPGGGETESFNAAQLEEMIPRAGRPLAALALTMRGGDSFDFTSVEGLISYHFECFEPEESDRFASFVLAKREARRRALNSGSPVEIYFDGEGFRLYRVNPLPVPPAAADFELVATVEVPVPFRIQTVQLGAGAAAGPENFFVAEVHSDDSRANPGLQEHGNSELYLTEPFEREIDAARAAADWIRSEFPTLDADIESVFDLEPEDVPL